MRISVVVPLVLFACMVGIMIGASLGLTTNTEQQDPSPIFQISAAGLVFFAALTLIINARSRPPERPPR